MHLATSVPTNFDEVNQTRFRTTGNTTGSHAAGDEKQWQYPRLAVLDKASNTLARFGQFNCHRVASAKPQQAVAVAAPKFPAHDEILATRSVGTFEPRTRETAHIPENLAVTSIRARQGDPIPLVRPVADDPDGISISVGDCCGSTLRGLVISNRQAHCQPTATHPGVGTRARDRTVEDLAWLETSWHLDLKWLVGVGVDDLHDVPFLYTRRDLNFYDLQKLRPLSDCG